MTSPAPRAECARRNGKSAGDDNSDDLVERPRVCVTLARPDGFVLMSLKIDFTASRRTWPLSPYLPGMELELSSAFNRAGIVLTLFCVRGVSRFRHGRDVDLTADSPVACMVVECDEGNFATLSASLHSSD